MDWRDWRRAAAAAGVAAERWEEEAEEAEASRRGMSIRLPSSSAGGAMPLVHQQREWICCSGRRPRRRRAEGEEVEEEVEEEEEVVVVAVEVEVVEEAEEERRTPACAWSPTSERWAATTRRMPRVGIESGDRSPGGSGCPRRRAGVLAGRHASPPHAADGHGLAARRAHRLGCRRDLRRRARAPVGGTARAARRLCEPGVAPPTRTTRQPAARRRPQARAPQSANAQPRAAHEPRLRA